MSLAQRLLQFLDGKCPGLAVSGTEPNEHTLRLANGPFGAIWPQVLRNGTL
jgi:hypothetical protein